jgi:predicted aminopeptidase
MLSFAAMRSERLGLVVAAIVLLLPACSTLSYYAQSITGQVRLMYGREPVQALLANPAIDTGLKRQLRLSQDIRDFASRTLALPDNDSYRSYVQLDQPFVVWSVFATPALSLKPRQWCFPITGCVPYRGYFSKATAHAFAKGLRAEGMDVYIGGVPAYSTLGWFDDPLLSSMLSQGESATAAIIFHELAHQQVYAPGDAAFNEGFAVAVEKAGVRRWLRQRNGPGAVRAYEVAWRRKQEFFGLIEIARARLSNLYSRAHPNASTSMREAKRTVFARMRADYRRLKQVWKGYDGYDYWFKKPINNAKLISIAIYRDLVPHFERWLTVCRRDFARFYRKVAELEKLRPAKRKVRLKSARSCS